MNNTTKIELALSDLTTALVEYLNNVEEKRMADYLKTAHHRIFLPLAERLATVEARTANLDERASDDSALDFLLDDYEARISALEDEMSGVLTSDDVREILESSDLKITIS